MDTKKIPKLSIVVPVFNEAEGIENFMCQDSLRDERVEVLFVDGGSSDGTLALIKNNMAENMAILMSKKGRANQMNTGASRARGKYILFLHADTQLGLSALQDLLLAVKAKPLWGRFDISLDGKGLAFRVISFFINWRSRLTGIATGDQAIFVEKAGFEKIGGYPCQELMEDVELSSRLKRIDRPCCLNTKILTSARKWQHHGIVRTVLLMWRLRAAYALGASPSRLVRQYYKT